MRRRLLIPPALCLLLGACSSPPAYPPPPQRQFAPEPPPPNITIVSMNDPRAEECIISNVLENAGGLEWRWTLDHPELRFHLPKADGWKFAIDFGFPPDNFRDTGPVTVSFVINDHLLDKVRFTTPGDRHYEKPVPAAWLRAGDYNVVRADVDPPWIAPSDKARLGFVLHRVGFVL